MWSLNENAEILAEVFIAGLSLAFLLFLSLSYCDSNKKYRAPG